jgi:Protein of unknown function (DUF3102)
MNQLETIETEVVGQRALFDYSVLDAETRIVVQQRAREIETIAKRMASDVVEIGGKLAEVKDRLGGNGKFNEWLAAELRWSERAAYNFIAVWQRFNAANFALENVAVSALYLLAAPSTPAEAVEVAKQIADSGEKVTHGVAKEIVRQAKDQRPKQVELIDEPGEVEEETGPEEGAGAEESPSTAVEEPRPKGATKPAPTESTATGHPASWFKTRVEITITLMPGPEPRKIMHSVRAGEERDDIPFVGVTSGERELLNVLPPITRGLVEKAAAAFAKKQAAKPAKKPAAKSKPAVKKPAPKSTKKGGKK